MYTFDHDLFMALNFDGGPVFDQVMLTVSGYKMWLPLYALTLYLVWRNYGWRKMVLFLVLMGAAVALADMIAGIFKHSGLLKGLWASFPPRPRPMFTPSLEGLGITPDSLSALRRAAPPDTAWAVHVPHEALGGRYGTVSGHAATIVVLATFSSLMLRRRWFSWLMVCVAVLVCYSRIYLAKHFPMDLVLGTAVGLLSGWVVYRVFRMTERRFFRA